MTIRIEPRSADHADAAVLLRGYLEELGQRLGGFDEQQSTSATTEEMAPPTGLFFVLYDGERPVACGGLKRWAADTGEIKRMYVVPDARGRGHGRRILAALEQACAQRGWPRIVLDTAAPLQEAAALYQNAGYHRISPYNDNTYAAAWFLKDLGSDFGFEHRRHHRLWHALTPLLADGDLSHDRCHLRRVYGWCLHLAPEAGADPDLAGAAALVHDLAAVPKDDPQRPQAGELSAAGAMALLAWAGYSPTEAAEIGEAVSTSSWSRGLPPAGPLGRVLQDADRLDAMGALGVARTFACAQTMVSRGRRMRLWAPADPLARSGRALDETANVLDHFLVKLMHLAEGMNLPSARLEARMRHQTMERFLAELEREAAGAIRLAGSRLIRSEEVGP